MSSVTCPNQIVISTSRKLLQKVVENLGFILQRLKDFQTHGLNHFAQLQQFIDSIRNITENQNLHQYPTIMNCVLSNFSLLNEFDIFFQQSLNDSIQFLDESIKNTNTHIESLQNSLNIQLRTANHVFDAFMLIYQEYHTLHQSLFETRNKMTELVQSKQHNSSAYQDLIKQYKTDKNAFLTIEKDEIPQKLHYYNEISDLAKTEDQVLVNLAASYCNLYDIVQSTLQKIGDAISTLSQNLQILSQNALIDAVKDNEDTQTQDTHQESDFRSYIPKVELKKIPKLKFDIFSLIPPNDLFADAMNASYFIATKKFNGYLDECLKFSKDDIFQLIQMNENNARMRHLDTGEIGLVHNGYFQELKKSNLTIIKKVQKTSSEPNRYVFALVEDTEGNVKCIEADGSCSFIQKNLLCDVE